MALALLSLLFLLARPQNTQGTLPFAEVELQDMIALERLRDPSFSSVTEDGTAIEMQARDAGKIRDGRPGSQANALRARLTFPNTQVLNVTAPLGEIDEDNNVARLQGGVLLAFSDGTRLETQAISSALRKTLVASSGQVTASGPFGEIEAGLMRFAPNEQGENELHFTNGVRLLYRSQTDK
ncbi:MAG: LPS export ABC transporter periplasmic protein LptC [Pseudomonadota bacterium]